SRHGATGAGDGAARQPAPLDRRPAADDGHRPRRGGRLPDLLRSPCARRPGHLDRPDPGGAGDPRRGCRPPRPGRRGEPDRRRQGAARAGGGHARDARPRDVRRRHRRALPVAGGDAHDRRRGRPGGLPGGGPGPAGAGDRDGDGQSGRQPRPGRADARSLRARSVTDRIEVLPLAVAGEIAAGADLAQLVLAAAPELRDGDVVVVAHKAVSKSEGRVVELATVTPSAQALELSQEGGDPRMAELVLRESRRIVRRRAGLLIAETHHGFVCASAGIDRSNGPAAGWAVLLPVDPDASAARLRAALERRSGARLAVVVADTMGRALRRGIVGTAIGASGLDALRSYAGTVDPAGYELRTTAVAVADELASAADLVLGKLERVPAALIRGFEARGEGSGRDLVR